MHPPWNWSFYILIHTYIYICAGFPVSSTYCINLHYKYRQLIFNRKVQILPASRIGDQKVYLKQFGPTLCLARLFVPTALPQRILSSSEQRWQRCMIFCWFFWFCIWWRASFAIWDVCACGCFLEMRQMLKRVERLNKVMWKLKKTTSPRCRQQALSKMWKKCIFFLDSRTRRIWQRNA